MIIEHSYVNPRGKASPHQVSIADDGAIEGFRKLVDAIHNNGSKVVVQINHAGAKSKSEVIGTEPLGPSAVPSPDLGKPCVQLKNEAPLEMTEADIDQVVADYAAAAGRAKAAGADGVEIHAAHGYLLGQFYSPLTNKRTDAYTGATLAGRLHLHRRIIDAVRKEVGDDYLVGLRFGAVDDAEGGAATSEVREAASILAPGLDFLDISGNLRGYVRPGHSEAGWYADVAREAKLGSHLPVIVAGNVKTAAEANAILERGDADLIGIARPLLRPGNVAKTIMEG